MSEVQLSIPAARFEESLCCPVCKDLFVVPTAASCGHVFCAICISRHLLSHNSCPSCGVSIVSATLRTIKTFDDTIAAWKALRPHLSITEVQINAQSVTQMPNLAQESVQRARDTQVSLPDRAPAKAEGEGLPPGTAACPICQVVLPIAEIEGAHIVKCLASSSKPRSTHAVFEPPKLHKVPLTNYMTLNDKALRKALQTAGLPCSGPRTRLIARHREWQLQWNANAEAQKPEHPSVILQRMRQWEKTMNAASECADQTLPDAAAWGKQYDQEFKELEENALAQLGKRKRPGLAPEKANADPTAGQTQKRTGCAEVEQREGDCSTASEPVREQHQEPQSVPNKIRKLTEPNILTGIVD